MRPRAKLPLTETDTREFVEQVRQWITALGFEWAGPGGTFRLEAPAGRACWRVYSEWAGTGVIADIDAQSGELLAIADASYEAVAEPLQIPDDQRPAPVEVANFVRTRLAQIGWQLLEHMDVRWDRADQTWRLNAALEDGAPLEVEAAGKKGSLRLVRATCE